ncbi:tetratricopeptide repeat protein [Spirulina subsalsa FACHB-351]|uniref:Tetratricopeptide repeat protein n=1 Tax=Spirulina subsalsa FACHB-351 TaxID=234711 RepID=A0ABT3L810_9CYAN|nr:tetratricopeptide repeat protein [Spirulina subsalsa]MCW6037638.1 tetratricopeptide repeat protein [Spirulina subsalsa FACHB-351]
MRDRYLDIIDQIVDLTLQGKIRSKHQVYRLLEQEIQPGTGEIFERCLQQKISATEAQLDKKLKATRILRALQTIQGEWERYSQDHHVADALNSAFEQLLAVDSGDRLAVLLRIIDPNQNNRFTLEQIQQLAKMLEQGGDGELMELAQGLKGGLQAFATVEPQLISWMYERSGSNLGFGGAVEKISPWPIWSQQVEPLFLGQFFKALAFPEAIPLERVLAQTTRRNWLSLALLLQSIQRGLVAWFDQQPYDLKVGKQLATRTFLTFAVIWSQVSHLLQRLGQTELVNASFQVTLQLLRTFAQREDFPLYGGMFAALGGEYLRYTLTYFDEPLGRLEATSEKAKILTLLGYSQRTLGHYDQALAFHEQAIAIARTCQDQRCEIANLNHLARTYGNRKQYPEMVEASQRALILARQLGDRLGETNALINLGYGEVFAAQAVEQYDPDIYESAVHYLRQGVSLGEQVGDRQSQALAYHSLGIAYGVLQQPQESLAVLAKGLDCAQKLGDLYLQGLLYTAIAEAYYSANILTQAVIHGCLGMYLLAQIEAQEWRQGAGLITGLLAQWGEEIWQQALTEGRPQLIALIGVDGYDALGDLLAQYRAG